MFQTVTESRNLEMLSFVVLFLILQQFRAKINRFRWRNFCHTNSIKGKYLANENDKPASNTAEITVSYNNRSL